MKTKKVYETPEVELVELAPEQTILDGSVGTVSGASVSNWTGTSDTEEAW